MMSTVIIIVATSELKKKCFIILDTEILAFWITGNFPNIFCFQKLDELNNGVLERLSENFI